MSEIQIDKIPKRGDIPLFITKYEYTESVSKRMIQLNNGSEPLVDIKDCDTLNIAMEEIRQGLLDFKVKRKYPNGEVQVYDIREMNIRDY